MLQFELAIHGAESLKDKRRVVRSVKDRLHREHMVSVAEVARLDSLAVARLGVAAVGNDGKHLASVLDRITDKLRALTDAELVWTTRELIRGREPDDGPAELDEDALAAELLARADAIDEDA
ncbi:MAG: DUF503 domain-containing protein [Planctomycetota bacterium]